MKVRLQPARPRGSPALMAARPLASSREDLWCAGAKPKSWVGAPGPCCGCEGGGASTPPPPLPRSSSKTAGNSGGLRLTKKQETQRQGRARCRRHSDLASSPWGAGEHLPRHPELLAPQGAVEEEAGGCCRGLGCRWAACWARHGAPHPQGALCRWHRGHSTIPTGMDGASATIPASPQGWKKAGATAGGGS